MWTFPLLSKTGSQKEVFGAFLSPKCRNPKDNPEKKQNRGERDVPHDIVWIISAPTHVIGGKRAPREVITSSTPSLSHKEGSEPAAHQLSLARRLRCTQALGQTDSGQTPSTARSLYEHGPIISSLGASVSPSAKWVHVPTSRGCHEHLCKYICTSTQSNSRHIVGFQ